MAQDRACRKETARPIRDRGAIERRETHEDARIQIRDRPTFQQMKEMPARWPFRSIALIELADRQIQTIGGGNQLRHGGVRLTDHDEQRPFTRLRQIARRLEDPGRQRFIADGVCPEAVFGLGVNEVPRRPAEGEHLGAFREDLDLARRAEHGAHVPVLHRRPRVGLKRPARSVNSARTARPPPDVDDVEESALRTRQEQRMDAFSQPEEALNPRQRLVVRQR